MTVMALNFWRPPGSAAGLKPAPSSCPEILPPPSRRTPAPRACSALLQPAPHAPTAGCPAGGRRHRSGRPPAPHESLSARGARPRQASQALSSCAASFQKKSPPLRSSTDQRKSVPLPSRSSATSAASRVRAEAASSPRWTLGRGRAHKGGGRAASSRPPALLRARGAGSAPRTMPSRETQRYRLPCPAGAEVPPPARLGGCLCARRHRAKARRGHLRSDRCWSSVASGRVTRPCHFHLQSPPTPDTHVTVTAQLTTRLSRTRDGNPAVPALARGTRGVRGASGAERCRVGRGGDRGCPPRRAVRRQPCSRPFLPAASVLERARRHREAPQARGLSPASPTSALQGHADA